MKPEDMEDRPMPELPAALKQNMTRYKAPPGLERRIRHMAAQQARGPGLLERIRANWMQWVPVGASFACGALLAVTVVTWHGAGGADDEMERQVVASHVRSLMADHLTDVASTDQHTVKPWFTGKLDYAPPVVDLAQEGFPLVGGRLDYIGDRAVAALVYRRRGHTINLFVLPASDAARSSKSPAALHGFQVAEWEQSGMRFWAVSDVSPGEVSKFVALLKAAQ